MWILTHVAGWDRYPFRWINQVGAVRERSIAETDQTFTAEPHEWDLVGDIRV